MNYLLRISPTEVIIGGQVANTDMIAYGWFEYDGTIPVGYKFDLKDGELIMTDDGTSIIENQIRAKRDLLLSESDWSQGKDIPKPLSTKWAKYR